jgi:hypothetical protein
MEIGGCVGDKLGKHEVGATGQKDTEDESFLDILERSDGSFKIRCCHQKN